MFDKGGVFDELKRAVAERALNAEMDHHLSTERSDGISNSRNGYGKKTVITDEGKLDLAIPRDRLSTFDPHLIARYRRRLPGFDEKIISMYARGMTVREIRGHLEELYGLDVSPDLISAVTDDVLDEVARWQNRPLERLYALVFFDALRVKIRDEGTVRNKAIYVALGVRLDGHKEVLGRLAVDRHYQGRGYGWFLLADTLYRAVRSEIASFAVIVDAKDDSAKRFYERESFLPFPDQPMRLFRPMTDIAKLFE